jgi:hypothetical protein
MEAPQVRRRTWLLVVALALLPAPVVPQQARLRPGAAAAGLAEELVPVPCRQGVWSSGAGSAAGSGVAGEGAAGERAARPSIVAFCRLGAWVDHYDLGLDPATVVRDLAGHRVGTLYLQTGRFSDAADVIRPERIGRWLEAGHAAGLRMVGWYLPGYGRWLRRDVRRAVAVARFRSQAGERFDALAVDIEHREVVPDAAGFSAGVAAHLERVRREVGAGYPVGAIVPAPRGMALYAAKWAGFPWRSIGRHADVVQTMGYWSYRGGCSGALDHCPYPYTVANLADAARLSGLPVHAIGGVADAVTPGDVADFVRAARDARAVGASLYDYATTVPAFWSSLERFDRLAG